MKNLYMGAITLVIIAIAGATCYACEKENLSQEEVSSVKQQKSVTTEGVVIVTPDEMQYLGDPEPIEEFKSNLPTYLNRLAGVVDCHFVFSKEGNTVRNLAVSRNSTEFSEWSNRLDGYCNLARANSTTIEELIIGEIPPMMFTCINFNSKTDSITFAMLLMNDRTVKNVSWTDNGDGTYTVCWEDKK